MPNWSGTWLLCLSAGLVALTIGVFVQNRQHEFIVLDDLRYVVLDPRINQGLTWENFFWAWGNRQDATWHPLTTLSLMFDAQVYGVDPGRAGGFLTTNLALHAGSVCLLFLALCHLTRQAIPSALVAALFAIHPLSVESVSWVSERKGLLAMFFGAGALCAYSLWIRNQWPWARWLTAFLFLCSLLSKQMLVTLPFVLLLLDHWPLNRMTSRDGIRAAVVEKWPLFFLTACFCAIAFLTQSAAGTVAYLTVHPLEVRIQNAFYSYTQYLRRIFWPTHLAVQYPYPAATPSLCRSSAASAVIMAAITAGMFYGRRRFPFLIVGWLWFLGSLLPLSGIVQIGSAGMASRYAYFPAIGIFIATVWWGDSLLRKRATMRPASSILAAVCVGAFALVAGVQASYWGNSQLRFAHDLRVTPRHSQAHTILGNVAYGRGEPQTARRHYELALGLNPNDAAALNGLGLVSHDAGRPLEAIEHYRKAARLNPRDVQPLNNLGIELGSLGRYEEAAEAFERVLEIEPDHAAARQNLANTLNRMRRRSETDPDDNR